MTRKTLLESHQERTYVSGISVSKKVEPMTEKQPLWSREKWAVLLLVLTVLLFLLPYRSGASAKSPAKPAKKADPKVSKSSTKAFYIDEYEDPAKAKEEKGTLATIVGSVFAVIKYAFYLALVLCIGYLAVLGIKILMSKNSGFAGNSDDLINILETRYLAPNKALYLIEVGERLLLIATGGTNLEMISEFNNPAEVESLRNKARNKKDILHPFQDQLNSFVKNLITSDDHPPLDNWKGNIKATTDSIQKKIVSLNDLRRSKESAKKDALHSAHVGIGGKDCSCPRCRLERIIKAK